MDLVGYVTAAIPQQTATVCVISFIFVTKWSSLAFSYVCFSYLFAGFSSVDHLCLFCTDTFFMSTANKVHVPT